VNISALSEQLVAWVKNQGVSLLQGNKNAADSFQVGQQYEGKVLDKLANGRHLVSVNSRLLDMNLPAKTQAGDTVRLTNINAGTRPTFFLNQAEVAGSQQVKISNAAQQVNTLLQMAKPAAQSAMSHTAFSNAALSNTALLQTAAAGRPIVANVALLQNFGAAGSTPAATAPLLAASHSGLPGQPIDAPRASAPVSSPLLANSLLEMSTNSRQDLPVKLAQTLAESGLFYESHLAKWNRGALSIEALMREPQAQLKSDTPGAAGVMKAAELAGMPAEAARLAGQQLQILEGEPFLWQGLAWPGQTMQWLIREETDGSHNSAETDPFAAEWSTELNLTLPRIGEVHAQLGLNGDRIRLRLQAADTSTCAALEAALPLLAHALQANGLKPVEMQVNVQAEVVHGAA